MRQIREIGSALRAAAASQARWEREVSAAVLGSRKRLLWLLLLALPVFLLAPSQAAQILPEKIPILGGSRAFMPSFVTETMFFGSILVGLIAGLITGVIGAGGGYILTPALMSFDVRGIMAVGTDQFHLFAKHSAYAIPEGKAQARAFVGTSVDLGIRPRDFADAQRLALLVRSAGIEAKALPDGRVRVTGDLGRLSETALADADAAFRNETGALAARYQMPPEEVIYGWWVISDGLTRRYVQEARGTEAEFTRFVSSRALEPAYNFRGIEAKAIRGNATPLAGLLAFYVLYTLWYGFSIMLLFEGLGIGVDAKAKKREI